MGQATLLYSTVHNNLPDGIMAKKKATTHQPTQAELEKILKLITDQQFKSEADLKSFLKNLENKPSTELQEMLGLIHTSKEEAQHLVNEALEQDEEEARNLICKALSLDPDNAEAYLYLAENEVYIEGAHFHFQKALSAAEKAIGKEGFEEYRGKFWNYVETRLYMRAKAGLANCLYKLGKPHEAIKHYEEMLDLNPTDNLGIRYILGGIYLAENQIKAYEQLYPRYNETTTAWLYNYALYLFKKLGDTDPAQVALLEAYKANKWVPKLLIDNSTPSTLPEYLTPGKKSEAEWYLLSTLESWEKTPRAVNWLISFAKFMSNHANVVKSSKSNKQKRSV